MKLEQKNWEDRKNDFCPLDLGLFQALERERVLEVLQRDKALRTIDADRVRRLRVELHGLCLQTSRIISRPFGQRSCARCQRVLGKFWDCGSVCCGCSHRICNRCQVVRSAHDWKCTVCHAYREFKIKSGEWFLEQQAKKFPSVKENSETTGDKMLQSYQRLSFIAVVPPTPPPFYNPPSFNRLEEHKKPFTKSMENLVASVSAHIKKLSKSQNDLSEVAGQLTVDHGHMMYSRRKSLSDGAINRALCKVPSLPILSTAQSTSTSTLCLTDDDVSSTSAYSDDQRDSNSSTGMDSVLFENTISVTGEIEVVLAYNNRTSCLEITIKACRNLMFRDTKKKCHPYVNVCLLPKKCHNFKMKTAVRKGKNPVYNETFTCVLSADLLSSAVLQLSVWHSRGLKRRLFLGETLIRLADMDLEDTDSQRSLCCKLNPKAPQQGGDAELQFTSVLLLIQAQFHTLPHNNTQTQGVLLGAPGQLTVLFTDVSKLLSVSKTAHFEGILCLPGHRELVRKTSALKKTDGSIRMSFSSLSQQELQQATLTLNLWEKNCLLTSARLHKESSWQHLQRMPGVWQEFNLQLQVVQT